MNNFFLISADYFFLVFHSVFTIFNLFGWIFIKTRKLHLFAVSVTCFSWFVLGIWYGFGYCFCTQWHWEVRALLERPIRSHSYIHFLILEITGIYLNPRFVDITVMVIFIIVILITVIINLVGLINIKLKI